MQDNKAVNKTGGGQLELIIEHIWFKTVYSYTLYTQVYLKDLGKCVHKKTFRICITLYTRVAYFKYIEISKNP